MRAPWQNAPQCMEERGTARACFPGRLPWLTSLGSTMCCRRTGSTAQFPNRARLASQVSMGYSEWMAGARDEFCTLLFVCAVIMGIDEAGRGPVIGTACWRLDAEFEPPSSLLPLVALQGPWCTVQLSGRWKKTKPSLQWGLMVRSAGLSTHSRAHVESVHSNAQRTLTFLSPVADSKALSAEKRAGLFKGLKACGRVGYILKSISAAEISACMLRRHPYSLNAQSHDAAMQLVQAALDAGCHVTHVYVDTVGDPGRYQAKLTAAFNSRIQFTVEKKADSTFKVVSAASICAKVTRDAGMQVLQEAYQAAAAARHAHAAAGQPMGSGYPSDATTKAWLASALEPLFGFDASIRYSWSTTAALLEEKGTRVVWEAEEDDPAAAASAGTTKLSAFFTPGAGPRGVKRRRSTFTRRRGLKVVASFVQDVTDGARVAPGGVSGATPSMTPGTTKRRALSAPGSELDSPAQRSAADVAAAIAAS